MSLRSRAASGQGDAGIYITLRSRTASGQGHAGNTLRSRTASGQGHAGNTSLCSGAASGQGCVKHPNLYLR